MYQTKYMLTCLFVAGLFLQSRNYPVKSDTYMVYINYENYSVRANVLYDSKKVKTKMGRMYYWYINDDIKNTDGSFDGKLLHGEYKSFFRDMGLREQGSFNYGLKSGVWRSWFENGKIHEIINYQKGKEHGTQELYNEQGEIVSKIHYKNGMRQGKSIVYKNGKNDTVIIYKNGKAQLPNPDKIHSKSEKNNLKDTTESQNKKSHAVKDTTAVNPKSSNKFRKIFNKQKKSNPGKKPAVEKETEPIKKNKPSSVTPVKKS
ncbi:hypothetical protein BH11BAC7_BH11BAC7_16650 [soil metagenome]